MTWGCLGRCLNDCTYIQQRNAYDTPEADGSREDLCVDDPLDSPRPESPTSVSSEEAFYSDSQQTQAPDPDRLQKWIVIRSVASVVGSYPVKVLAGILAGVAAALLLSGIGAVPVIAMVVSAMVIFLVSTALSAVFEPPGERRRQHIIQSLGWAALGAAAVFFTLGIDQLFSAAGAVGDAGCIHAGCYTGIF